MKTSPVKQAFACCAIAFSLLAGCSNSPKRITWPAYVKCLPEPGDLIAIVSDTLFNRADFQDKLTDLARARGTDVVVCVVDQLVRDWSAPGAASSPERGVALERGQEFLHHTGTHVEVVDGSAQ